MSRLYTGCFMYHNQLKRNKHPIAIDTHPIV